MHGAFALTIRKCIVPDSRVYDQGNVNVPVKYLHVFALSCVEYLIFSLPAAFIKIDNSNEILANICRILYINISNINS